MLDFYKFDIAQYERETKLLTIEQRGIYIELCNYYFSTYAFPIPFDLSPLCKIIYPSIKPYRASPKIQEVLDTTFIKTMEGYIHPRLQKIAKNIENNLK
jgi:uncharacterized protein YdaU (DUF1376 family)